MKRWLFAAALSASGFPAASQAFDSESLSRMIAEKGITSIEDTLAYLPDSLLSHYVLVFKSRSLQEASYRDPRVILFGANAKFVLSFNGEPSQAGYHALEVMDFDDRLNQFTYREILFPDSPDQGKPVSISAPNPEKCQACHGNPARPVWDTHPVWPGVYGERYHTALGKVEQAGLNSFLAIQATHPRYRNLKNTQMFRDRNTFSPDTKNIYEGAEKEPPNAMLSRLLSRLNNRAIAQEIKTSPKFDEYRYALLATLSPDCGPTGDYIPNALRDGFMTDFPRFSARADLSNQEQQQRKNMRTLQQGNDESGPKIYLDSGLETLTPLRYIAEKGLGIPTRAWTTNLEKGTYDFTAPQTPVADLDRLLREAVAQTDTHIQGLAALRDAGMGQKYCKYLRDRSLAAIKGESAHSMKAEIQAAPGLDDHTLAESARKKPPTLQQCIACHQAGIAPALPFGQEQTLASQLNVGIYPRGSLLDEILFRLRPEAGQESMPRGSNLSLDERAILENYFRGLARQDIK